MSQSFARDIEQMMADWNGATQEQRAEALAIAAKMAADAKAKLIAQSDVAALVTYLRANAQITGAR